MIKNATIAGLSGVLSAALMTVATLKDPRPDELEQAALRRDAQTTCVAMLKKDRIETARDKTGVCEHVVYDREYMKSAIQYGAGSLLFATFSLCAAGVTGRRIAEVHNELDDRSNYEEPKLAMGIK